MRTTLNIDEQILKIAKHRAMEQGGDTDTVR